jgi:hypothetical protein
MNEFLDTFGRPFECGSPIIFLPPKSDYLDMGYPVEFELTAAGLYRAHILDIANDKSILYGSLVTGKQQVRFDNVFLFNDTVFNQKEADDILKKFGPTKLFFKDRTRKTPAEDLSYDDLITRFVKRISQIKIVKYYSSYNLSITTKDGKIVIALYIYFSTNGNIHKPYCSIDADVYKNNSIAKDHRIQQAMYKLIDDYLTANP